MRKIKKPFELFHTSRLRSFQMLRLGNTKILAPERAFYDVSEWIHRADVHTFIHTYHGRQFFISLLCSGTSKRGEKSEIRFFEWFQYFSTFFRAEIIWNVPNFESMLEHVYIVMNFYQIQRVQTFQTSKHSKSYFYSNQLSFGFGVWKE